MKPRRWLLGVVLVAAACTYKEYNTYNDVRVVADAGVPSAAESSGGGTGGAAGGDRGGASGAAGAAGSVEQAGAGGAGNVVADEACSGCLRLTSTPPATRDLMLEFPSVQNLAQSALTWRIRVVDVTGDVRLSFYAQSGDDPDDTFFLANVALASSSEWQYLGADMSSVPDYAPPTVVEGTAGGGGDGFDMGFPFDKTRVERVGVYISPNVPPGILNPFSIEIDSLTFSNRPALDLSFASGDGGLQLVESDGASIAGATLTHVDE